jgi:hypothetical protein
MNIHTGFIELSDKIYKQNRHCFYTVYKMGEQLVNICSRETKKNKEKIYWPYGSQPKPLIVLDSWS